ncbi:hypothetical protein BGX24_004972 [Mortierella sp. AD032]|nr:hypothetical protein BGX24_004972 [Mortierella sp. AD032]
MLYSYIERQIQDSAPMTKLVEKDAFAAMSEIVNVRISDALDEFGVETLDLIKTQCLQPHISNPSDQLQEKPSKAMSESELVEVWSNVLGALAGHKLPLRSQVLILLMPENRESPISILNDLTRFKVDGASEQQVEVQYRKNLRVNQAMMLYLKEQIGMPLEDLDVLALDVHEVFVSDLVTKHMLRLPDSSVSWKLFLRGSTLSVLLAYVNDEEQDAEVEESVVQEDACDDIQDICDDED